MHRLQARDDGYRSAGASDHSNADDDTDTLGRAILRHERDARRIQSLLSGMQQTPDRQLPRSTMARRQQTKDEQIFQHGAVESEEQGRERVHDVEPGINIPRAWGRKARPGPDWTRASRIPVSTEVVVNIPLASTKVDVALHQDAHTAWDERHISLEDTPPSMRRRRPLAQPTSLRTMNPRLREIVKATKEDFSENSLLASTPAANKEPSISRQTIAATRDRRDRILQSGARMLEQAAGSVESSSDKENAPQPTVELQHRSAASVIPRRRDRLRAAHSLKAAQIDRAPVPSTTTQPVIDKHNTGDTDTERPQPNVPVVEPPTPMVTGGWIDTPKADKQLTALPDHHIVSRLSATKTENTEEMPLVVPNEPHKHDNQQTRPVLAELPLSIQTNARASDATIEPLHDALLSGHESALPGTARPAVAELIASDPPKTSTRNISKRQEDIALEALDKHITEALTGQGHTSLASRQQPSESKKSIVAKAASREVTLNSNGEVICDHCGRMYTSVWRGLWIEFRSNFWTRDAAAPLTIRPTRLGSFILALICWYLLESVLCLQYCNPRYAVKMVGYGVDPNAPKFPFVIPTLLFRPFEFAWRPALAWLSPAMNVVLNWIMGVEPQPKTRRPRVHPFVPNPRYTYPTIRQPAKWLETVATASATSSRRVFESAVDAVDEVGRMW